VLALIPLAREVFWAPMALAMMGGLIAATILTLTFLPALYALCFCVKNPVATALEDRAYANATGIAVLGAAEQTNSRCL
jgi:multidrug efflux pump